MAIGNPRKGTSHRSRHGVFSHQCLRKASAAVAVITGPEGSAGIAASETPWTQHLWIYDLRTNTHFTLKTNRMQRSDLEEFVTCFHAENRHDRTPTWSEQDPQGHWRVFTYEELLQRDKCNLDIFWLKDESLEDSASLPEPDVIIVDIIEDLRTALEQLEEIAGDVSVAD
jgi:type I restriction enzyme M protein